MKKELELVAEFHRKCHVPVAAAPTLIPIERSSLRHNIMAEEVQEYEAGARNGDLENIAKELVDILYTTYGTILEHGLQDKIEEIFAEVHRSNMSKDAGVGKAVKGDHYVPADIKKFLS